MIVIFDTNIFHENYFIKGRLFDALKEVELVSGEIELKVPRIVYLEKRSQFIEDLQKNLNLNKVFNTINHSSVKFGIPDNHQFVVNLKKLKNDSVKLLETQIIEFDKRWNDFFDIETHVLEDFENTFVNYFEGYGMFENAKKSKSHIPDSVISESVKRLLKDNDVILLTNDNRLNNSFKATDLVVCRNMQELFQNKKIKDLFKSHVIPSRIVRFIQENEPTIYEKLKKYIEKKYINTYVDCSVGEFETNAYVSGIDITELNIVSDGTDSIFENTMTLNFNSEIDLEVDADVSSYDAHMFGVQVSDVDESNWLTVSTSSSKSIEGQILIDLEEFKDVDEKSMTNDLLEKLLEDDNIKFEIY